jgi:hypothetical protein
MRVDSCRDDGLSLSDEEKEEEVMAAVGDGGDSSRGIGWWNWQWMAVVLLS